MERKVGEIFEYNGEWYQCVECDSCGKCSLRTTECGSGTKSDIADEVFGACSKVRRTDNKHAIFKKLEKVGEPHFIYDKIFKGGKVYVQNFMVYEDFKNHKPICDDYVLYDWHEKIISIEVKQNKENMEEKKLNFKPFDLEAAKAGKPVCTRDGRKARIICFDAKCNKPIVALIYDCNKETVLQYLENGRFFVDQIDKYDLMMFTRKKEGWVNVYKSYNVGKKIPCMASIYPTKEEAKKSSVVGFDYVDTVKIEWEE